MTDQEIKPRMVDGVGWCDAGCPQYTEPIAQVLTKEGRGTPACAIPGPGSNTRWPVYEICPVWAQRMAAWAEEARDLFELDPDAHPDAPELLSRYPGKDGE